MQIPSLQIGTGTYSSVVLTIGSIVTPPSGTYPNGTQDTYNPVTNGLTVPAVKVGNTTFYNAVATVANLASIGSVSGADTFDGAHLHLPYVLVGSTPYYNVVLAVSLANVSAVHGGMPGVMWDQYDAAAGLLTIGAVQVGSKVYTNVILRVGISNIVSVGVTESVLYSFAVSPADGASPQYGGSVIQASDGNFYGMTFAGGANNLGAVIKITPDGTETVIHSFGTMPNDGANPYGNLIQGSDGNFYGTTTSGGANAEGTVFKISMPAAIETVLYSFNPSIGDGVHPGGSLIQAKDGNFYGVTPGGGGANREGTVFKITPGGTETTVYAFGGISGDGQSPTANLMQASDGNFYGMTLGGGTSSDGTVFRITMPAGTETVLHSFGSVSGDATSPHGSLIQASDGNLYGMTQYGGANSLGAIIKIALPGGIESVAYSFGAFIGDSAHPEGSLVQASDGALYGMTLNGGTGTLGAVIKMTLAGTESVLYSFGSVAGDGYRPYDGLIQASDANLYGMTNWGGANNLGVVIKINW